MGEPRTDREALLARFYGGKARLADGAEFDVTMVYMEDGNHVRLASDLEVALRDALIGAEARSPAREGLLREAAQAVMDRFGGYGRGYWSTEDEDALTALAAALSTPDPAPDAGLDVERRAAVMEGWAASPELHPASKWLSLSVALAILRGTHPALSTTPSQDPPQKENP